MYTKRNYNVNDYKDLKQIIPVGKWISEDVYEQIWTGPNGIWNFIQKKRTARDWGGGSDGVWMNNWGYNYMDTKQFYFSWENKSTIKNGTLVKEYVFDHLDINHEDTRYENRKALREERQRRLVPAGETVLRREYTSLLETERPESRRTNKREVNGPKITELSEIKIEV